LFLTELYHLGKFIGTGSIVAGRNVENGLLLPKWRVLKP